MNSLQTSQRIVPARKERAWSEFSLIRKRLVLSGFIVFGLMASSFAADPLVPTDVRPLGLLHSTREVSGLRLGIFDIKATIVGGLTHDDNTDLSAANRESDVVYSLVPEITASTGRKTDGVGGFASLSYKPTMYWFADHSEKDAMDHFILASGQWAGSKLTVGLAQSFAQVSGPVIEVGDRVSQQNYGTDLTVLYKISDLTALEVNPRLAVADPAGKIGHRDWAVDVFLDHVLASRLTGSLGGSFGLVEAAPEPQQRYERALARLLYALATKVDVSATVGGEWRQYTSGQPGTFSTVFGISGVYRPFERTTLTLAAHRRNEVSMEVVRANYTTSGFTAEVYQRLWDRYFISLAGGYDNRSYLATAPGVVAASRTDDYYTLRVTAGAALFRNWAVSVYYLHAANDSTDATHRFEDNQVGFATAVVF